MLDTTQGKALNAFSETGCRNRVLSEGLDAVQHQTRTSKLSELCLRTRIDGI